MGKIPAEVSAYMRRIGARGGKQTSEAKAETARANARRPRPGRRKKAKG